MDNRFTKGYLLPDLNYKKIKELNYIRKPVPVFQEEQWRTQGYRHEYVNGCVYNMGEPESWCKEQLGIITNKLNLKNCGFSFYKMSTMEVMPVHSDHYETYSKVFNIKTEDIFRAIVFLQPWKSGHYFEIDNTPITNWIKGEYVLWQGDVPHMAANIGLEDRYTLQITGIKNGL